MSVIVFGLRGMPDVEGGIEAHAKNLYPLLVKLGVDVEVITRSPYTIEGTSRSWNGVKLRPLWSPKTKGLENIIHSFLAAIYCILRRPDIVHIHAIGPGLMTPLLRLSGICVVFTHHGFDYEREKWGVFAKAVLRIGEFNSAVFSNHVIAISSLIGSSLKCRYLINPHVIPNGIAKFQESSSHNILQEYALERQRYILTVGRFVPEKRHHDLIAAFRKAKPEIGDWKLVIAGSLDADDDYTRKILRIALNDSDVVLIGFQTGMALHELYRNAGIFVLASSHEGYPIALLEALAYDLEIIASNIDANRQFSFSEKQYFSVGDADELAEKLIKACREETHVSLRNPRNELSDWSEIALKTVTVYANATSKTDGI